MSAEESKENRLAETGAWGTDRCDEDDLAKSAMTQTWTDHVSNAQDPAPFSSKTKLRASPARCGTLRTMDGKTDTP